MPHPSATFSPGSPQKKFATTPEKSPAATNTSAPPPDHSPPRSALCIPPASYAGQIQYLRNTDPSPRHCPPIFSYADRRKNIKCPLANAVEDLSRFVSETVNIPANAAPAIGITSVSKKPCVSNRGRSENRSTSRPIVRSTAAQGARGLR